MELFKHRIRLCGIARHDDRIALIEQFNPETGNRYWGIPGGGMEYYDDDLYRGVAREVLEETGLVVTATHLRFVSEYFSADRQLLMLQLWVECQLTDETQRDCHLANITADDNITDARWWTKQEIFNHPRATMSHFLLKKEFWEGLQAPDGMVIYLGRTGD
jgi:8-oxo-dGTP pyrophosphatase MutT (NUDIX family)